MIPVASGEGAPATGGIAAASIACTSQLDMFPTVIMCSHMTKDGYGCSFIGESDCVDQLLVPLGV